MPRMDWKTKAQLQLTHKILRGESSALFLFHGKRLVFREPSSIRAKVLMGRPDSQICVFVGMYDFSVISMDDVMDDVLCAHKRSETLRRATYFKRKRREV